MTDPFSRALADPYRPLRVYAPLSALAAVGFLLAAVVLAATASGVHRQVAGRADGPTVTLSGSPRGSGDAVVYGARPGGAALPSTSGCTLTPDDRSRPSDSFKTGTYRDAGVDLDRVADLDPGWQPGDVLVCPGLERIVVVTGHGPAQRLAVAGAALVVGLGALVLAVVGLRLRAQRR